MCTKGLLEHKDQSISTYYIACVNFIENSRGEELNSRANGSLNSRGENLNSRANGYLNSRAKQLPKGLEERSEIKG